MATKTKKPKQTYIPGTAPPSIPAVNDAADRLFQITQQAKRVSQNKKDAMLELVGHMLSSGIERYETPDGLIVTTEGKTKVAVKKKKKAKESSNGDE